MLAQTDTFNDYFFVIRNKKNPKVYYKEHAENGGLETTTDVSEAWSDQVSRLAFMLIEYRETRFKDEWEVARVDLCRVTTYDVTDAKKEVKAWEDELDRIVASSTQRITKKKAAKR